MENNLAKFPPALNAVVANLGLRGLMAPISAQDLWKIQISEIAILFLPLIRYQEINGSNNDQKPLFILTITSFHFCNSTLLF